MSTRSECGTQTYLTIRCFPAAAATGLGPPLHLPLDGARESRWISEAYVRRRALGQQSVHFNLVQLRPPTLDRLRQALQIGRARPAFPVVHVSGCVVQGRFAMERENGREHLVAPDELARAFRGAAVSCVLLTICSGDEFGAALVRRGGVKAVITSRSLLGDAEAALIARESFPRLAFGECVRDALRATQQALVQAYILGELMPLDGHHVPDLKAYGRKRAREIILCGDATARLPAVRGNETLPDSTFDLAEPPSNLPQPDSVFVGRGAELVIISDWMAQREHQVIALTGLGGSGKSTIAVAAALRNSWRFRAIVYFSAKDSFPPDSIIDHLVIELDAVLRLGGLLTSLGTPEARRLRAAEILNAHPYLLVLDNLEVLSTAQTSALANFIGLLHQSSGTVALLTLRPESFPPLVAPAQKQFYWLPIEPLSMPAAISLLAELLQPGMDREATPAERHVWEQIPSRPCSAGDQSFLREAARYTDLFSSAADQSKIGALVQLARAAHAHPFLLRAAVIDLQRGQRTWAQVCSRLERLDGRSLQERVDDWIGSACDDLARSSPAGWSVVQAMLAFSGGASADALAWVWNGRRVPEDGARRAAFLQAAEDAQVASLLTFNRNQRRFDLHSLVRQYVWRRRPPSAEQQSCREFAHARYFLEYVKQWRADHARLEMERDNLFAIMSPEGRSVDPTAMVGLATHLFEFLCTRGFWREGRVCLKKGIVAARQIQKRLALAQFRQWLGTLCRLQGDHTEARSHLRACLTISHTAPHRPVQARAKRELGILQWAEGNYQSAERLFLNARALQERQSDSLDLAKTLHALGVVARARGRYREALASFMSALAIAGNIGHPSVEGRILHDLGVLCRVSRNVVGARAYFESSLSLSQKLDDPQAQAWTLHELGVLCNATKQYDAARSYFEESYRIEEKVGDRFGKSRTLLDLGILNMNQGRFTQAREFYLRARELQEELKDKRGLVATDKNLAWLEFKEDNFRQAEKIFRATLPHAKESTMPYWHAQILFGLALCLLRRHKRAEAFRMARRAYKIACRLPIPDLREELEKTFGIGVP